MKKNYLFLLKKLTFFLKNALVIILSVFYFTTFAQNSSDQNGGEAKYRIGISTGSFIPEVATDNSFITPVTGLFENKYFRLVQFYNLPTDVEKKNWESQGLKLMDYLPGNAYFAVIDKNFNLQTIKSKIRSLIIIDKRFKLDAAIFYKGLPDYALENGMAKLTLSYYAGMDKNAIISDLRSKEATIGDSRDYCYQIDISLPQNKMDEIINLPYIQFVGTQPGPYVPEEYEYRNATARSNYINSGYNGLNYNGQGVTVAIGEGGVLTGQLDIYGRLVAELDAGVSSHKIGVMQNCAGAGNEDPSNRNNSWGASVVSAQSSPDYVAMYNNYSVLYTNHSYGAGTTPSGGYDATARAHDLRIATLPNHLVIYSSGNSGAQTGFSPYAFPTWATITGAMKMSKNMLEVGSLLPNDDLGDFSSRGPMYDGRIIPQVVIEGNEGTSFAAPKTTGILAMLDQVYKSKNSGTVPASSLLRAIIMNTADDLDNPGPDFRTGYGRINVRRAYNMINESRFLTSTVANGASNTHTINVPANTKQVRVLIVWPDPAAAVNASVGIVNNLNLLAIDPSSNSYNPWVLDASLPSSDTKLNTPAVRGVDNLNTMEQVTVDNPQSGNWTIQVNGYNVPSGPQTYYLTYEFLSNELTYMFPLKNEKLESGATYNLRWDSYGESGTFALDYQLDGGNWVSIANGVDATKRVYPWVAPTVTGIHTMKFRVKRGTLTSESDVNYIGAIPANFRISKVCGDVVTLKWSPVTGATSYKVYRLGSQYMEEVTSNITFSGNSAVLTGQSTTSSEFYAVSALTGTYEGLKTMSLEKVAGDYSCTSLSWTGAVSTDWFNTGNWSSGAIPTSADNVSITSAPANQPNISNTGAVCNNVTIESGASLTMNGATAYTLSIYGDWTNNGTFNRGIGTVDFVNTTSYQEISGTSTTAFYKLSLTKGTIDRILEVTSLISLNASTNPLVINSGTFKLSSASTITPFTNGTGAELNSSKGIWNNGGTINYGNFTWYNAGLLRLSAGTINSGTNNNNHLIYWNGGSVIIEGGMLNVAGAFRPNSGTSYGTYTQSGGVLTVCTSGSTATDRGAFEINSGVAFTITDGTIVLRKASSNTTADAIILASSAIVNGGTLQIGDGSTPASQTIRINSTVPVNNVVINATNNPVAQLITNGLTIKNDLTISGGTLNANGLAINIGGNWTNNGTFTAGAGTVSFNGYNTQNLGGAAATTFNNLTINNSNGMALNASVNTTINGILNLTSGVISTNNNKVIISSTGSVSRTLGHIFGNLQKYIATGSGVSKSFEIGDASVDNYTPVTLNFASVSNVGNVTAKTTAADHPNIGTSSMIQTKSVNRYWSISNSGLVFTNFDATFNFLTSDLDAAANTSNLNCGLFSSSNWTYPPVGSRTATSTVVTGITAWGDFMLAENCTNPDVPTLSASVNPVCAGNNTTLSVTTGNLNNATGWIWYSGSCGGNLVGTGSSISVSPGTQTNYYVRGEGGCVTAGVCANISVSVNQPASVSVSVSESANTICSGTSVTYTAAPVNGGTNPSYQWKVNGNNAGLNQNTYTYNPVNGDVISCVLTSDLGCVTSPTAVSNAITMIVNPAGTVETTASACDSYTWALNGMTYTASGDYTYISGCITNILHLTITPSSTVESTISACTSYTWPLNGTTYTTSGNYTYVNGCTTNILHLTINPVLTPVFPLTYGPYNVGDVPALLPTVSQNGISGTWNPPTISTAAVGSSVYTFTPAAACANTITRTISIINPVPQFTFTQDIGTTLQVSWPQIAGANSYALQYSLNAGGPWIGKSCLGSVNKVSGLTPGTLYYWRVYAYNASGVQVGFVPAASYTTSTVNFINNQDIGSTCLLQWNDYDTWASSYVLQYKASTSSSWNSSSVNLSEKKISGLSPLTSYDARVAVYKSGVLWGTSAIASFTTGTVNYTATNVTTNAATLSWAASLTDLSTWTNLSVVYYRPVSSGVWLAKSVIGSNPSVNLISLLPSTNYECYVMSYQASVYWGAANIGNFTTASTKEMQTIPEVNIYPNPFTDQVSITFFSEESTTAIWKIYDITGKIVLSGEQKFFSGNNEMKIDGTQLPKGVYTLSTIINDKLENVRLIKQ